MSFLFISGKLLHVVNITYFYCILNFRLKWIEWTFVSWEKVEQALIPIIHLHLKPQPHILSGPLFTATTVSNRQIEIIWWVRYLYRHDNGCIKRGRRPTSLHMYRLDFCAATGCRVWYMKWKKHIRHKLLLVVIFYMSWNMCDNTDNRKSGDIRWFLITSSEEDTYFSRGSVVTPLTSLWR